MPATSCTVSFAVVAAILLIGCVNLADAAAGAHVGAPPGNRGARDTRREPLASRSAAADRNLLLALVGGIIGAVLAWWGKDFMSWLPARETTDRGCADRSSGPRIHGGAVGRSAALLFGVGPALRATRRGPRSLAEDQGAQGRPSAGCHQGAARRAGRHQPRASRQRRIPGAHSLHFSRVDVGFNADNVLVFRIDPAVQGDNSSAPLTLYDRIMAAIEAVPGVQSSHDVRDAADRRNEWEEPVQPDGYRPSKERVHSDCPVELPRDDGDTAGRGTGPVSRRHAGPSSRRDHQRDDGASAVRGTGACRAPFSVRERPDRNVPIEVIGIARDSKYASLEQEVPPTLFMPHAQSPPSGMTVEVRTASDPMTVADRNPRGGARTDPAIALAEMKTQRQQIAQTIGKPRAFAALTTVAGADCAAAGLRRPLRHRFVR